MCFSNRDQKCLDFIMLIYVIDCQFYRFKAYVYWNDLFAEILQPFKAVQSLNCNYYFLIRSSGSVNRRIKFGCSRTSGWFVFLNKLLPQKRGFLIGHRRGEVHVWIVIIITVKKYETARCQLAGHISSLRLRVRIWQTPLSLRNHALVVCLNSFISNVLN